MSEKANTHNGNTATDTREPDTDTVVAADLFCGAGGLSIALARACEELGRDLDLTAVNHNDWAIQTHQSNHPTATQLNAEIQRLHPTNCIETEDVDILIAAPECTHFSAARGDAEVNEQHRAGPYDVLRWVDKLQPRCLLVENVPGFSQWGPVEDGTPIRDGSKFEAWVGQLQADRYSVTYGTLDSEEYGDPTSRKRLFVMACRDHQPELPTPTHTPNGDQPGKAPFRTASEITDNSDPGESVWTKGRGGLCYNTMCDIASGITRCADDRLKPYAPVIPEIVGDTFSSLKNNIVQLDTVEQAVQQDDGPFVVTFPAYSETRSPACTEMFRGQHSGAKVKSASQEPFPTVATSAAICRILADPVWLSHSHEPSNRPCTTPLTTNSTDPVEQRYALCTPELYPIAIDLQHRMLNCPELAAAQGFPQDYEFKGRTNEIKKQQIGNAVPVNTGTKLVKQLLRPSQTTFHKYNEQPTS